MVDPTNCIVGQKLYVDGQKQGYVVMARDERYIIATKPFNPRKTVLYFIIDLEQDMRGPDNMVFCSGYESDEDINERLKELQDGEIEVSFRRSVKTRMVDKIGGEA